MVLVFQARFYPAELSVKLFSGDLAKEVTNTLLAEAGISADGSCHG